ncbi:MAG TPA: OmpA family protein [Acidimicrobiales bacterium]
MSKRRRHEEHEEHVNHEAWVIPYADMLTLLMGLFLVLWSMSTTDMAKLEALRESLAEGFGLGSSATPSIIDGGSDGLLEAGDGLGVTAARADDPTELERARQALEREEQHARAVAAANKQLADIERMILESAQEAGVGDAIGTRREERGLVVTVVTDEVLFSPGSADLAPDGKAVLDALVPALRRFDNPLAIEGHTDNVPINTSRFPSNWELSTARATSVLRYLVDVHGFAAHRMTASGYGEQRPIGDNATAEGRAANRRVELVVLANVSSTNVTEDVGNG